MPITARYVNGPPLKFGNLILSYTFRLDNASGSRNRISVVTIERSAIGIYGKLLWLYKHCPVQSSEIKDKVFSLIKVFLLIPLEYAIYFYMWVCIAWSF